MKNTGFKQPSYEEKLEKLKTRSQNALQRKKMQKATLTRKSTKNKAKVAKRKKLTSLKSLRDKADALLTPLCKKHSPNCESCGKETQVGHHWIEKSRSSFLRYDLRNLIPLCHSCHAKIHNRFGNSIVGGLDVAEIIINKRGRVWKEILDLEHHTYQKVNRDFYIENHKRLTQILEEM